MSVSANGLTSPFSVQTKNIIQIIISWQGEQMNLLLNLTFFAKTSCKNWNIQNEVEEHTSQKMFPPQTCSRHSLCYVSQRDGGKFHVRVFLEDAAASAALAL